MLLKLTTSCKNDLGRCRGFVWVQKFMSFMKVFRVRQYGIFFLINLHCGEALKANCRLFLGGRGRGGGVGNLFTPLDHKNTKPTP